MVEAGLAGQVQVGVPLPVDGGHTRTRSQRETTPEAEERIDSPLDSLLGLTSRPSRGRLIEVSGTPSSGCTALAYRLALGATARGEWVGWVDLPDALDPRSVRRAGVRLESLLWVRPRGVEAAFRSAELLLRAGFAVVAIDLEGGRLSRLGASVWTRLLRATQGARGTAVVLGAGRAAGSFATLALYTERRRADFEWGLLERVECSATLLRNRSGSTAAEYPFEALHRGARLEPAPSGAVRAPH